MIISGGSIFLPPIALLCDRILHQIGLRKLKKRGAQTEARAPGGIPFIFLYAERAVIDHRSAASSLGARRIFRSKKFAQRDADFAPARRPAPVTAMAIT